MQKSIHSSQQKILLALLRKAREAASITQQDLAERVGMSQSDISKVERGVRRLDILELRVWLIALGVPLLEFIGELDDAVLATEQLNQQAGRSRRRMP